MLRLIRLPRYMIRGRLMVKMEVMMPLLQMSRRCRQEILVLNHHLLMMVAPTKLHQLMVIVIQMLMEVMMEPPLPNQSLNPTTLQKILMIHLVLIPTPVAKLSVTPSVIRQQQFLIFLIFILIQNSTTNKQ